MTTPSPKPKRRWFQLSLRTLLVFVLLVSIGMSWFAVKMQRARRQKEAVQAIEKAGWAVAFDYEVYGSRKTSVPKWARALLGDDFFLDVAWVSVSGNFGDDDASHLKALTNLASLYLCGAHVTNAGLQHFEGLTDLRLLNLSGTQVTDAGLQHLDGLTNLNCLSLMNTQVTDAGMEYLKGMTKLSTLDLRGTQVTPEGVEKLQEALPECICFID
jgi:hypothetical protein